MLGEILRQQPEAGDIARPGPAVMTILLDLDFKNVARLGSVDGDRTGKRVDLERIERSLEVGGRPIGANLPATGIRAFKRDRITRLHHETGRSRIVPAVNQGIGTKRVVHRGNVGDYRAATSALPSVHSLAIDAA